MKLIILPDVSSTLSKSVLTPSRICSQSNVFKSVMECCTTAQLSNHEATPIPIEEESQQSAPAISDMSMHAPKTKSRILTWGGMKYFWHGKGEQCQ